MVNDDVALIKGSKSIPAVCTIFGHVFVTKTETDITDDHIIGLD